MCDSIQAWNFCWNTVEVNPQNVQQMLDIISAIAPDTVVSDTTNPGQSSAGIQFTLVQEGSSLSDISQGDLDVLSAQADLEAGTTIYHVVDAGPNGYTLEVDTGTSTGDHIYHLTDATDAISQEDCLSPTIDEVKDNSHLEDTAGCSSMEVDSTLNSTFSSSPEGKKRDHKGRYLRKVSGSAKQQAVRAKDRQRKEMSQKLAIFNKFAKFVMNDNDFEFFAMFRSKGETHFAGTHTLQQRFKDNLNLIDYQDSMIETRIDSVVKKIHLQKAKGAAVEPSPSKASDHMSFLPGLGLAASQKASLEAMPSYSEDSIAIETGNVEQINKRIFVRKHRKPIKLQLEEMETSGKGKSKGRGKGKGKGNVKE